MTTEAESVDRWGDSALRLFWRKPPVDAAERTRRRVTLHLVPYLFFLYILAYIDRMNISVAGLGMTKPVSEGGLGIDDAAIGFGGGLFFLGYWILEIPSTNWVERRGARWVFVRILILWGAVAAAMGAIGTQFGAAMFSWIPTLPEEAGFLSPVTRYINSLPTSSVNQFYFFRFLLGFFEGGFFPSVIVYLSHWFRQRDRAKAIATFALAMPLSGVIGYTFNAFLLKGVSGWRLIFVIEGVLPILAGIATIFMLPDRPRDARWLTPKERQWLEGELEREHVLKQSTGRGGWRRHLVMVLLLTSVYFMQNITSYGLSTFMPRIMVSAIQELPANFQSLLGVNSSAGSKDHINTVGSLMASLPYWMAFIALLANGWHSDRTGERIWHAAIPMTVCSVGVALAAWLLGQNAMAVAAILVLIFIVGSCAYTHIPPFWSIPTMFLGAGAAASAIGFINMIGNIGSFCGPYIFGKEVERDLPKALLLIAPWSFGGAVLVVAMDAVRRWRKHD